ncbi:hypothetical protein EYC80_002385 [Monilinia laxa]|uniref:Uncharacterized protein n=1 Tax=Monilinia laxa TaxID=61186 RepID=A0A5N6K3M6_MONLA|nr:hypothetical protein EYC80_002385 [Monilinia laxa]
MASSIPLSQAQNSIGTANPRTLHRAMDTFKSIPSFIPTTAGHMILRQKSSSQNQNSQPTFAKYKPPQFTPNNHIDAVQFNEDDFSDDDNIDLDTNYALPMSQSLSRPQSQPSIYSQHHMPPTQPYGIMRPPPLGLHAPRDYKPTMQSERIASESGVSSSRATPRSFIAASYSANIKNEHTNQFQKFLADAPYLWYYQMEQMYCTSGQNTQNNTEKIVHRQWLAKLGIDVVPFCNAREDQLQRDLIEVHWALKSAETRREIEIKAVRLKHLYLRVDEVPLRLAPLALRKPMPIKLIGLVPLSFSQLEQTYFKIPERKMSVYHDFIAKRLSWLKELGLDDPRYLSWSKTPLEEQALNNLYEEKSRVERRAIQAKAIYINAMLDPPNMTWETFETTYEIYPASTFTVFTVWSNKRREWLERLGLNISPFRYTALELADGNVQCMEVAWSAMTDVARNKILETAQIIKEEGNPVLNYWSSLEESYGFAKEEKNVHKSHAASYAKKRESWIIAIGLDVYPFKSPTATPASLQASWSKKSIDQRKSIVKKAKYEKERHVRDMARKNLEKAGDNYKYSPSEAKKTSYHPSTKNSSGNKVSKSTSYSSNRYGYSGYTSRSNSSPYYGYARYGRIVSAL